MRTVRLPLTSPLILLCALAAAQTGSDVPKAPEDGGPRNWAVTGVSRAVNFREEPSTKAAISGSFRLGTILDNLGCQRAHDSALRAGQGKFDATGKIPCAQAAGQPMTECEFGVARAGGGYATVVIKRPTGPSRAIFFRMGKPVGADTSQADGYLTLRATKESDLHMIRLGAERYEIPDAVILGG